MAIKDDVIRIGVADDDLSVCQLFSNYINTLEKCKVILEATSGVQLIKLLETTPGIDMVILDIQMPLMSGYETANYIRKKYPAIKIIFFSVSRTDAALHLMVVNGGHGLISKRKDKAEIKTAIHSVMKGEYYYPINNEVLKISSNGAKTNKLWQNGIGDAELSFLRYCASEMPYKEIAGIMKMEERQFEHLRETMFKKLDVKTRTVLVLKAIDCGLIALPASPTDVEIEGYYELLKSA
jgi:two-component system, NarL family, invasion response regulator UvrY